MEILKVIFVIFEALLVLNLLIFVHELGHFLAARWRKMRIDRFAIWFGKPVWKKKVGGIEYVLGWIPAGGYVALPQMATMEIIEGKSEDSGEPLPAASAWTRLSWRSPGRCSASCWLSRLPWLYGQLAVRSTRRAIRLP